MDRRLEIVNGIPKMKDGPGSDPSANLIAASYASGSANAASAGVIRLARTDVINWRNEANGADLSLSVNSSNKILFNGVLLQEILTFNDTATIDLSLSGTTVTAAVLAASLDNSHIATSAGIDALKISSGVVDNAEFDFLNGVTSAIQTQLTARVVGPGSATDNAVARFDTTTGKLIKNSSVLIDNSNNMSGVARLDVDNIRVDGNTISSTDSNGNITLTPNGTGTVASSAPLQLPEVSTPATPSSGFGKIYFKSDNKVYSLSDAGVETVLSAPTYTAPSTTIYTSGSGTYNTPAGALYLEVEMVGGGGGGGASGTGGGGNSSAGSASTFGSSTCNGGDAIVFQQLASGAGGTVSSALSQTFASQPGMPGGAGFFTGSAGVQATGGVGGSGMLGAGGRGNGGGNGSINALGYGAGGAGGGTNGTLSSYTGPGAGSGGYLRGLITTPSPTYSYAVGGAGSGGSAGSNGVAGSNGTDGFIRITAYFQ